MKTIDQLVKAMEMELEGNIVGMSVMLNEVGATWNLHFDGKGNLTGRKFSPVLNDYTNDASGSCGRLWID